MAQNQFPASTDGAVPPVSEQTPLLGDQHAPEQGNEEHGGEPVEEPSMREIVVIMSSIWLGVFLAALGVYSLHERLRESQETYLFQIQPLSRP